jgi:hypothetical protein
MTMSIIVRRSSILRTRSSDELSLQMLQGPYGSAFDQIAGGKVLAPFWNWQSSFGNPNDLGADTMFGSGQAVMGAEGTIYDFVSPGANPTITGSGVVMATFTLPAFSFDTAGRGLTIYALGSMASGTTTRCQIYFNTSGVGVGSTTFGSGVAIADTTLTNTGGAFSVSALVYKYGAGALAFPGNAILTGTASNTQVSIHQQAQIGSTLFPLVPPTLLTASEAGPISVAIVGTATNGGAGVGNLVLNFVQVTASN